MDFATAKKPFLHSTYDIYVGRVPKDLQKGKLEEKFSKYGTVVDVLYRHGTGNYGYAIVKFRNQKDAERLLRENEKIIIEGQDMEIRPGRLSNQGDNYDGASPMGRTLPLMPPYFPPLENSHYIEPPQPSPYDGNYSLGAPYIYCENNQVGDRVDVMCTNVENILTFHGYVINRSEELQALSIKLNSICSSVGRLHRKPMLNNVYGGIYHDNRWYRCFVMQSSIASRPGMCLVRYIDFGNVSELYYSDMVELPEPLRTAPPIAVKCNLMNLKCTNLNNHVGFFSSLILNKRLILNAIPSWGHEYQVFSCTCFETGVDVIGELLRNGCVNMARQQSPEAPMPSKYHWSEKNMNSKFPDPSNQKPKKPKTHKKAGGTSNNNKKSVNACNSNKKVDDGLDDSKRNGDLCSKVANTSSGSIEAHLSEINNNVQENGMNYRSSSDDSQHAQEFKPKKIMQRDTSIPHEKIKNGTITNFPTMERPKKDLIQVDWVISNLRIINDIRSKIPAETNDDLINDAFSLLLMKELDGAKNKDLKGQIEESCQKYNEILNEIRCCDDKTLLQDLKEKRKKQQTELLDKLKEFIEDFDYTLLEIKEKIKDTIQSLSGYSDDWRNVYLAQSPSTVDELLEEYDVAKKLKKESILKVQQNTNEKHQKFEKNMQDLLKEFALNVDGRDFKGNVISKEEKSTWMSKFVEALKEFNSAIEQEHKIMSKPRSKNQVSIVNCLLEKLDVPKEKVDAECELYEKYKMLYDELNVDLDAVFDELHALRKNIQTIASNCVPNGDADKTNSMLVELHSALKRENVLMEELVNAYSNHFPELPFEYPDLRLNEYQKYDYLVKYSWDVQFFPPIETCNRIESSYISVFNGEPVVVKEFEISCESEGKAFIEKAVAWSKVNNVHLAKIKGIFANKDGNKMYALLHPVWKTLYESPLPIPVDYNVAAKLLLKVVEGLNEIHFSDIIHGSLHPLSILYEDGEVMLDFNFDVKYLQDNYCLKGINFQPPSSTDVDKSIDMYGFGCLVLWVLFPNLSFSSTDQGVPNINAFQSIINDVLSSQDFASLSALLDVNQLVRPPSKVLRINGFLKKLRIVPKPIKGTVPEKAS